MSKNSYAGMRLQQAVSFSPPLCKLERRPAIFWPGCALMSLDPQLLDKTYQLLKRLEPELGLSSACCGEPTVYLFPDKLPKRQQSLRNKLEKAGVQRIYTACPNCDRQLASLGDFEVYPIWPYLLRVIQSSDLVDRKGQVIAIHDPCPQRDRADLQQAVRDLIGMTGAEIYEPERSREKTLCCGNKGMLRTKDPEASAKIRHERLKDFPKDLPITACCQGCLGAFASEGRSTLHTLEVLFGNSQKKGWGNRFAFSRSVRP
jgi:Fe-S oxidoreductase